MKVWKAAKSRTVDRIGRGMCTFSMKLRAGTANVQFKGRHIFMTNIDGKPYWRVKGYVDRQDWRYK